MTRRFAAVLSGSALLLAVAACSDSTSIETKTEDTSPSLAQGELGYLNQHIHVMPLKSQAQEAHAARPGGGGGGTGIFYHGGPVLTGTAKATRVVAIYWSASKAIYTNGPTPGNGIVGTAANDHSLVGSFLSALGGSSYFNINTTYTDGTGARVQNSVDYRGYFADNHLAPTGTQSVTDAEMQAEVRRAIDNGYPNDGHTIYLVFTEGKVNLGGGFGTQYCAYHGHFSYNNIDVLYAAQPYNYAYPTACTGQSAPNGDPGADAEVNTLAHEIEEAATDPNLNAWYDRRGYENADKCAWTWGTTSLAANGDPYNVTIGGFKFLIQRNWINSGSGGCYKGLGSGGPIS